MDYHVRCAIGSDAASIASFNCQMALETENLALDPQTVLQGVSRIFTDPAKGFYLVAVTQDERVVGCLMVTYEWSDWRAKNIWWIQSVYVVPEKRRLGLFTRLLEHVAAQAEKEEVACLRLYAESTNHVAKSTYSKLGFCESHYDLLQKDITCSF
jgi:ribosomal protein S18 acetylase RimI-like enzyme